MYDRLPEIRALTPDDSGLDAVEPFMAPLITVSAFDLGQGRLPVFSAYRFLYERLVGGRGSPVAARRLLRRRGAADTAPRSSPPTAPVDQRGRGHRQRLVVAQAGVLPLLGRKGRRRRAAELMALGA